MRSGKNGDSKRSGNKQPKVAKKPLPTGVTRTLDFSDMMKSKKDLLNDQMEISDTLW